MQTLILIAHSTPPLLVPQAMRSTVYVLYRFILFILFLHFNPLSTPFGRRLPLHRMAAFYLHIIFKFLSSLILQSREQSAVISIPPVH